MHAPRWGLAKSGDNDYLSDLWALYVDEGVDIVLTASEHNYQRWQPLDATGQPTPGAPTEFVVGTGGHYTLTFGEVDGRAVAATRTEGALRLVLREDSAEYQFIDTAGTVLDEGAVSCGESGRQQPLPEPATTGAAVVKTGGIGVRCRAAPDLGADVITVVPEGATVELRGAQEGDWYPVRCLDRNGYISATYLAPDG